MTPAVWTVGGERCCACSGGVDLVTSGRVTVCYSCAYMAKEAHLRGVFDRATADAQAKGWSGYAQGDDG